MVLASRAPCAHPEVEGLGLRGWGWFESCFRGMFQRDNSLGFGDLGLGSRVCGLGFWVWGLGFGV
jgi:hypothetical protein